MVLWYIIFVICTSAFLVLLVCGIKGSANFTKRNFAKKSYHEIHVINKKLIIIHILLILDYFILRAILHFIENNEVTYSMAVFGKSFPHVIPILLVIGTQKYMEITKKKEESEGNP